MIRNQYNIAGPDPQGAFHAQFAIDGKRRMDYNGWHEMGRNASMKPKINPFWGFLTLGLLLLTFVLCVVGARHGVLVLKTDAKPEDTVETFFESIVGMLMPLPYSIRKTPYALLRYPRGSRRFLRLTDLSSPAFPWPSSRRRMRARRTGPSITPRKSFWPTRRAFIPAPCWRSPCIMWTGSG